MKEIKAPERIDLSQEVTIFLAGSIEMGSAEDWQTKIANALERWNVTLLNPRRDDWDSSWEQKKENLQFNEQVTWELQHMEIADVVIFYFDPRTKSPITLMEVGLNAKDKSDQCIVCCPEGFWRKGNIDVVCERYGIRQVDTLEDLIRILKAELLSKYGAAV